MCIRIHNIGVGMDRDQVDAILRDCRKMRELSSCYPCHRRKVKCDRGAPCDRCVKRQHPELCCYQQGPKRPSQALAEGPSPKYERLTMTSMLNSGLHITIPRQEWNSLMEELNRLRKERENLKVERRELYHLRAQRKNYAIVLANVKAGNWAALEMINFIGKGKYELGAGSGDTEVASLDIRRRHSSQIRPSSEELEARQTRDHGAALPKCA